MANKTYNNYGKLYDKKNETVKPIELVGDENSVVISNNFTGKAKDSTLNVYLPALETMLGRPTIGFNDKEPFGVMDLGSTHTIDDNLYDKLLSE